MADEDREDLALSVVLMTVAGNVDAIGYLRLRHLFVSFMSGDSTQFAVYASRAAWQEARPAIGIVALFVTGVIAGRLISRAARSRSRPAVLLVEGALLLTGSLLPSGGMSTAIPIVLAMGIQNAALHSPGSARRSLTYITGSLVNLGEKLADALSRSNPGERWAWLPYLLLWIGLLAGAACGALAYRKLELQALLIPAAVLVVLATALHGRAPGSRR